MPMTIQARDDTQQALRCACGGEIGWDKLDVLFVVDQNGNKLFFTERAAVCLDGCQPERATVALFPWRETQQALQISAGQHLEELGSPDLTDKGRIEAFGAPEQS